jgi:hypothetical protein
MRGKQITTLRQLNSLAQRRKAVMWDRRCIKIEPGCIACHYEPKRTPAAFIIGMPGSKILGLIEDGLYQYKTEGKKQ